VGGGVWILVRERHIRWWLRGLGKWRYISYINDIGNAIYKYYTIRS